MESLRSFHTSASHYRQRLSSCIYYVSSSRVMFIIRITSFLSIALAVALLSSAMALRHYVGTVRTYSNDLKNFHNLTHPHKNLFSREPLDQCQVSHFKFNEGQLKTALCEKPFESVGYFLLTGSAIFMTLLKIFFAIREAWPTFFRKDQKLMLSIWISRGLESELYLFGMFLILFMMTRGPISSQTQFLEGIKLELQKQHQCNVISNPELECRYGNRDTFLYFQLIHLAFSGGKILFIFLCGNFGEQKDEVSETQPLLYKNRDMLPLAELPVTPDSEY